MNFAYRRAVVKLSGQLKEKLIFNPFIFTRMFWLWVLSGITGGVIAGFYWLVVEHLIQLSELITDIWVIPLMACAGLLAGLVIDRLGDPGEMDLIVDNIRFKGGRLNYKNNPSMVLSSLFCISSGGSLGPEAPLVQVAGSTGTYLARRFKLKGEDVRNLTIAGMASAFTALFGAPLGGSLFALEILHHKHVTQFYQAMIPAIVASCSSYIVFLLITHTPLGPSWQFPPYIETSVADLGYSVMYALIATLFGWVFIFMVKTLKGLFKKMNIRAPFRLCLGGLLIGTIAYFLPLTRYFGHNEIGELLKGNFSLSVLCLLLVGKMLAISLTVTSGWRGGFIIPLFFVGISLGLIIHKFLPGHNATLIMVCCMAAINACVTRTPVSITVLLATMTGFHYFVPVMFASLTGFFLAPRTPLINSQLAKDEQ